MLEVTLLQVFDARDVTTPRQMFQALCNHIKYSTNGGNIRSAITVFPARRAGQRDFRVWNPQMICYAGYTNADGSVTGDPAYTTFTQVCQQLGWTGAGGRFDVLPLVVSAATGDPECFPIPEDLVLQVELHHPGFDWFGELGLRWFALPGVSSMLFDCGGVEFPAAPFNGWYMSTEIATRDLCDTQRYNLLQVVGERMGLDTRSNMTLWKDSVALEINKAVLHSFQEAKVTMVDHHTASESFMQFMENEHRERGGCPADWVWIVPPFSAALTPVFHQEMSLYYLKPSYEYQQPAWVAYARHVSALAEENTAARAIKLFRKVAMAVVFASVLYREALSKRVRVTIVYASETGRSQSLAHSLNHVFKFNFNSKVMCMSDYQVNQDVWDESLLLVVASTTGTGEPPTNGQEFVKSLYALKENASRHIPHDQKLSFWEDYNTFQNTAASRSPVGVTSGDEKGVLEGKEGSGSISSLLHRFRRRWESKEDLANTSTLSVSDPVRYAVFALGSTNYANFCAFGKYVDYLLGESGGCRLLQLTCGDELNNQEGAFNTWTEQVFKAASQEFGVGEGQMSTLGVVDLRADNVKLTPATRHTDLLEGLSQLHMKKVQTVRVLESKILHEEGDRWCQVVGLEVCEGLQYLPGDHVGLLPRNNPDLVTSILARLQGCHHADTPVQVLLKRGTGSQGDAGVYWEQHPRLPVASPRLLLSHYLDINTPPTPALLQLLAAHAVNNHHASTLTRLAQDGEEYRGWRAREYPHLLEVLEMFPSVEVEVGVVVAALPLLQPRYYSISSSPLLHPRLLHITLSGVQYRTRGGSGPVHQGVATGFLKNITTGDSVQLFHRSVANFHLPSDPKVPVVLVGAGSGIAPFRGFWQHYHHMRTQAHAHCGGGGEPGRVLVYYGCRTHADHLYAEEKQAMLRSGAITSSSLALSRQPGLPKMHVQELLLSQGRELQQHLVEGGGHVYVCGGEAMARGVHGALNTLLQQHGALSPAGARAFLSQLKEENRYHEDTFGVRVGTATL
ncbi:nitric oxide synthase, salivary gland isoform X1 [Procambarus clarkii]|uniref:nitric oxide synthase, salivary gland isoform X1 n=1 Tax=Procambarus clarkii TaxID=6728 RepID=UPI001E677BF5|nr:nitric oxide synthase, salivary gland-like isoform X1 [Procambarus clarkii]